MSNISKYDSFISLLYSLPQSLAELSVQMNNKSARFFVEMTNLTAMYCDKISNSALKESVF